MSQHALSDRIADVANETNTVTAPLHGLKAIPLVTLHEAASFVAREGLMGEEELSGVVFLAYLCADEKLSDGPDPYGLSRDEIAAIHAYTQESDFYGILNGMLRSSQRKRVKPFYAFLKLLLTAIYKLPAISDTVYRGVKLPLCKLGIYRKDCTIIWWGFSSTTVDAEVLQEDSFLGKSGERSMFMIQIQNGVDITAYSAISTEKEVLLAPGTVLKIIGALDQNELQIVQAKQVVQPGLLDFPRPKSGISTCPKDSATAPTEGMEEAAGTIQQKQREADKLLFSKAAAGGTEPLDRGRVYAARSELRPKPTQGEQTGRVAEQLNLALRPLGCLPEEFAERVAAEFLQGWSDEREGAQVIVRELLASESLGLHDIGFLNLLEDVKKSVEVDAFARQKRLGEVWARRLCKAIAEACTVLKQMAKLEHQLALYADSESQLRYVLQDALGLTSVTFEPMGQEGGKQKFRVSFASQADLEYVVCKSVHLKGFEEMGFRPPPESWVSQWVEAAFEVDDWRDCITEKQQGINRIFYNAAFETKVVNKFNDNTCLCKGVPVKVLLRFPVVFYQLPQGVDKLILGRCLEREVGGEVTCEALIYIGNSSRIAYATLEASPQIRASFKVARTVKMALRGDGGAQPVSFVWGPLEGEWLWSSGPPASIRHEYSRWSDEALLQIKNELKQVFGPPGEHKARVQPME